mmetsp:Transcript_52041/g.71047  ORF Transcript_52041/g.71047 Transcript_52041/m.71047 type:complete len:256 (+) Transcript_52041:716-1483(+)
MPSACSYFSIVSHSEFAGFDSAIPTISLNWSITACADSSISSSPSFLESSSAGRIQQGNIGHIGAIGHHAQKPLQDMHTTQRYFTKHSFHVIVGSLLFLSRLFLIFITFVQSFFLRGGVEEDSTKGAFNDPVSESSSLFSGAESSPLCPGSCDDISTPISVAFASGWEATGGGGSLAAVAVLSPKSGASSSSSSNSRFMSSISGMSSVSDFFGGSLNTSTPICLLYAFLSGISRFNVVSAIISFHFKTSWSHIWR